MVEQSGGAYAFQSGVDGASAVLSEIVGMAFPPGGAQALQVLGPVGMVGVGMMGSAFGHHPPEGIAALRGSHLVSHPLVQAQEPGPQNVGSGCGQIVLLMGIVGQVEQHVGRQILEAGVIGPDQEPVVPAHAALAAPGSVAEHKVGMAPTAVRTQCAGEALALPEVGTLAVHQVHERGRQIHVVVELAADRSLLSVGNSGPADDERHPVGDVVGELVVAPHVEFAVVLPVVGRNDDGRLLVYTEVLQILD